jgi:hypothetical protein
VALFLAFRLGCTLDELGDRMSGAEFTEWLVFLQREGLLPAHEDWRHAEVLTALYNGPLQRKNKQLWDTPLFMGKDRWAPPPPPRPKLSKEEERVRRRAMVDAFNAARRSGPRRRSIE